ncbi:cbb3-type cytochrome oxidase assembly protein CcoS [Pikeienuella piscinae]|uniref:Cbb3-type cytochrome oxidase assembly protein CcoS n=1 Tax=Pikeienuella piscinae TaxID=2748098 RepID=A0A7L5BWC5_9RHOB|nr:cbb3-type cytochrome oxidase assembly protein CcoS [Pikeienuella piscinae]QIE56022.1 cbb3-type cytochrome oxidase assembly protein CcoS [Pikeienuella piscinae]
MTILTILIPVTLVMGVVGLGAFFWSLRSGQYEDLEGDGARILFEDAEAPLPDRSISATHRTSTETTT